MLRLALSRRALADGVGSVLAAFTRNDCSYESPADVHHDNLSVSRGRLTTIRSRDSGASFDAGSVETVFDMATTADEIAAGGADYAGEAPVDFLDPDVLVLSGAVPAHFVPSAKPWLWLSSDASAPAPPILLPMGGLSSLSGQGSAMVRADGVSLIAMTAVTLARLTRRPLVYASADSAAVRANSLPPSLPRAGRRRRRER